MQTSHIQIITAQTSRAGEELLVFIKYVIIPGIIKHLIGRQFPTKKNIIWFLEKLTCDLKHYRGQSLTNTLSSRPFVK